MNRSPQPEPETEGAVDELFLARTVPFAFHGARLRFDLATTVFASAGIDPGSALLLRHLQAVDVSPSARVLDLGCGVGVLGVVLAALDRSRQVTFVDRDALACRFTRRNLEANGLAAAAATVHGSLGYDDVAPGPPFDLIVSNIPGKAGSAVLDHLISGAGPLAGPGTIFGCVVVQPLAAEVRAAMGRLAATMLVDKGNKTHQVLVVRLDEPLPADTGPTRGFEGGRYDRTSANFSAGDLQWRARTVVGLDEFDNLSHATRLLRGAFRGLRAGPCLILDPGQGHRAVLAARSGQHVDTLVSRDLLSLRASARCLVDNGLSGPGPTLAHTPGPIGGTDVPTAVLHADDKVHTPWFVAEVRALVGASARSRPANLILSGRSGLIGRIEVDLLARAGGRLVHRESRYGYRVVRYRFGR